MNILKFLSYCFIIIISVPSAAMSKNGVACAKFALIAKTIHPPITIQNRPFHAVNNIAQNERYHPPFAAERRQFYKQLRQKPWGTVAQKYIIDFQKKRYSFMKDLCAISPGLTPAAWHIGKHHYYNTYVEPFEKTHSAGIDVDKIPFFLQSKIELAIDHCGINPNKVSVLYKNDPNGIMAAHKSSLIVYKGVCDEYKKGAHNDWIQAVVFHEMQHLMHDDTFLFSSLDTLYTLNKVNIDKKDFQEFKKRYYHFAEKRADIFAGLMGVDYVRALMHYFQEQAQHENGEKSTHPLPSTRASYLKQLHDEMLQAINHA